MKLTCKSWPFIASLMTLAACGNNAELKGKLESVSQCINSPKSVQQSYDLAIQDKRIPVYLPPDNRDQYERADWYQSNQTVYESINWDYEDWSTLSDLSECDQALKVIETENPKDGTVKQLRSFLDFSQTVFRKYGDVQLEDASLDLYGVLSDAQSCLFTQAYPQAFISMNYDVSDKLFPMAFSIDWDGDDFSVGTATADGRNPLWRPIKSVNETGCLDQYESLSQGFIDWALSSEDDFIISWSDQAEYTNRFREMAEVVGKYNAIVEESRNELIATGATIPPMGPYSPPTIYEADYEYFSDYDFKQLLKSCESTPPNTFVNGRGETLTSPSQQCSLVQTLCNNDEIKPPLDEKLCASYIYK